MSNETLAVSLEVLEDGQVKSITNKGNQEIYLQPVILVDSKEANSRLEIKGSRGNQIRVSTGVSSIDGAAFSGTFEDLETALREMALKANGLLNGGVSSGGGGGNVVVTNNTDPSTATKQDQQTAKLEDIKENGRRKSIGKLIDLSADLQSNWGGFPVQAASMTLVVNGDSLVFQMDDVESANNKDLVQQLNNVQSLVVFDWIKGTEQIVFEGVEVSSVEVSGLLIEDNIVGSLGYTNFIDSADVATGAEQQVAVLMQQQISLTKELLRSNPTLEPAISLSYSGNTAINPTVTPDKDGKLIPLDRFGDITIFATNNNVSYRFDGVTSFVPARSYPRTRNNFSTELKNVNLNLFRMIGEANNARWAIYVNLYKK